MKNSDITKLIEKYQNGDHISDNELDSLVAYFKKLYNLTQVLPQEFYLFRREIQQRRLLK